MPRPALIRPRPRAQTLVLFALTLLLLCVMVLMTLSIGSKIIEKNDLNHMADVAAYNQAVVMARTFNGISLINRTTVSHMVGLAGVQSLISWTSAYRGTLNLLRGNFGKKKEPEKEECDKEAGKGASKKQRQESRECGCMKQMEVENLIEMPLNIEAARVDASWEVLDEAAAQQARAIHLEAQIMYAEQLGLYRGEMLKQFGANAIANETVTGSKAGQTVPEELSAPNVTTEIALRELGIATECGKGGTPPKGVACIPNGPNAHAVWAAMGTRGWAFTTSRANQAVPFMQRLAQILPPNVTVSVSLLGGAYFADDQLHGMASKSNQWAWADDHLGVSASYTLQPAAPACTKKGGFSSQGDAWVRSAAGGEEHVWPAYNQDDPPGSVPVGERPATRHVVGQMWPPFLDYNPAALARVEDGYGQPKTYALFARDYGVRERKQPWERLFKVGFTRGGAAPAKLDLRSNGEHVGDANVQTSIAAGIAYYHRPGHWKEPPNFFNPFWRATIMASDLLDRQSLTDVPASLDAAGAKESAKTFTALYNAGYRGF